MTAAAEVVLAIRDLRIAFPDGSPVPHEVVHGVDLELRRGSVTALVGESGSGKSVSAMSTLRLLPDSTVVSGSVGFAGQDLLTASSAALRAVRGARIGAVFQEPMASWNPVQTIGRQIGEAIRAHSTLSRQAVEERTIELLESVGLDDPVRIASSFPHGLSGGQLQRAMIAMATCHDPEVLIADEPTTALDVTVQAGVLDVLRGFAGRGTAILLITHDMGVVADLADDVVVLRDGEVVERGSAQDVLTSPTSDYTRALLAAVPDLGSVSGTVDTDDRLDPGSEPDVAAELSGVEVVYRRSGALGVRSGVVRAVDGVDLTLHAGRTLGLVGESGSGKSTVGRCLAGLIRPDAGAVAVGGADLASRSQRELRQLQREVGIVFQDPGSSLNPKHSIGWSIAEPLRLAGWNRRRAEARVAELLAAMDLDAVSPQRFPHQLSGGQRQRVAIARALALEPKVLVADEPTSALDVTVQARILDLVRSLQRSLGFACLFISHDLAVIASVADDVAVMRHGRVVEQGPAASVLGAPADPYTENLLSSAPVADPARQRARRLARTAPVQSG